MGQAAETPKHDRMMTMLVRLTNGEVLSKAELSETFGVNPRSIQRDLDDLRAFLAEQNSKGRGCREVEYVPALKGFRLRCSEGSMLSDGETLAVCKILLESRSLRRDELFPILEKLIQGCVPVPSRKSAEKLISNERHLYIEPRHGQPLIDRLWQIGQAIQEQQYMEIEYRKLSSPEPVRRLIKPVGLMFSEFYFYLAAFIEAEEGSSHRENSFPTIYRVDRLLCLNVRDTHFSVPYADRFQEGEFRKRVQFMYGGELHTVRFAYSGPSLEAVLDRLPTAKVLDGQDGVYIIEAEVYGSGIDMWLRSQGDAVRLLE